MADWERLKREQDIDLQACRKSANGQAMSKTQGKGLTSLTQAAKDRKLSLPDQPGAIREAARKVQTRYKL